LPVCRKKGTPAQRQLSHVGVDGDVGLHVGVGGDVCLFPVAGDLLALDHSGRILAPDRLFRPKGTERLQDRYRLVPDGIGLEGAGRLHGHEGQQLEEVVLDHVP
jgi:hypothetical protein